MSSGSGGRERGIVLWGAVMIMIAAALLAIHMPARARPGLSMEPSRGIQAVRRLWEDGRYSEALRRCRALLRETEFAHGPNSLQTAEVLDWIIKTREKEGNVSGPEFFADARRALEIREALLPPEDPRIADGLMTYGNAIHWTRPNESREMFLRAVKILSVNPGVGSVPYAEALAYLGSSFSDLNEAREGMTMLREAVRIQEASWGPDDPRVVPTLLWLTSAEWRAGHYEDAKSTAARAVGICETYLRKGHPTMGSALLALAWALYEIGDVAGGVSANRQGMEIWTGATRPDHPMVGSACLNLGIMMMSLGNYPEAIALLERAFRIGMASLGPGSTAEGRGLNNLGAAYSSAGDLRRAEDYGRRALAAKERVSGRDSPVLITTLDLLAEVLTKLGRTAEARRDLERAMVIAKATAGEGSSEVGLLLVSLSRVCLRERDMRGAQKAILEAFEIRKHLVGEEHPTTAEIEILQARVLLESGRAQEALDVALSAAAKTRRHLRRTARYLSEREAMRFESVRSEALSLAVQAGLAGEGGMPRSGDESRVWDEVIRTRTLVLDEMSARSRRIVDSRDPAIAQAARNLEEARGAIARLLRQPAGDTDSGTYAAAIRRASETEERMERELADKSSALSNEIQDREAGLAEVSAALPDGSALIAYLRYAPSPSGFSKTETDSERYLAMVLSFGGSVPVAIQLGPAAGIDRLIGTWRAEAGTLPLDERAEPRYSEAAAALRRAIWDPVADRLGHARMVFIVPDGALGLVSFATFPDGRGGFLLESGPTFHYLSAEKDLLRSVSRHGSGLLALGGPDFEGMAGAPAETSVLASLLRGSRPSCEEFRSLHFMPLPGAAAEIEEIGALWSHDRGGEPVSLLVGKEATESVFKSAAPGRRVVHLATHGFLLDASCGSALESAHDNSREGSDITGESPLLLSGLALAGANRRNETSSGEIGDDGILTAGEVAGLDLRGVEWIVLSACDTGVGPTPSREGVLGLRRSFQIAGAATVIMSLWEIGDAPAREWSRQLYESRRTGLSTADAMRQASLALLRARRQAGVSTHPFSWGAFVAAGDWR